jgi:hypothetical protein
VLTSPTELHDRVATYQGDSGWGFRVTCPGEDPYTSPAVYPDEPAARQAGAVDLFTCLYEDPE